MASSMFSGMAAQLMAMKGALVRVERSWMKRASTSLPVPDSPLMSTVQSVAATRAASAYRARELRSMTTGSRSSTGDSLFVCIPVTGASSVPARGCQTSEARHRNGHHRAAATSILRRFVGAADLELAQLLHQRG